MDEQQVVGRHQRRGAERRPTARRPRRARARTSPGSRACRARCSAAAKPNGPSPNSSIEPAIDELRQLRVLGVGVVAERRARVVLVGGRGDPGDHPRGVDVVGLVEHQQVIGARAARGVARLAEPRDPRGERQHRDDREQRPAERRSRSQPLGHRRATVHRLRPRGLREVARARQRLRDRRGRGASVRAHRGADPAICAAAHRRVLRRDPAALGPRRAPASSRGCGSSTPTARRPSCPATAPARRSCTCAAAAGPSADAFSLQTAARARSAPTITSPDDVHASTWARARLRSADYPTGAAGRARRARRRRAQLALPARPGRQPAVRDRASRTSASSAALDLPAIGPGIEHHELFPTARTCRGSRSARPGRIRARIFERGVGETSASGTGATGAAVAYVLDGGDLAGDRRARRRRARGRGGGGPAHQPDRLGGAGVPRHARRRLHQGAACDPSRRLERIPPYLFAELERKIAAKRAAGIDVISLGIGDPGHADLRADRRRRAARGRRSEHPHVPVEPRPRGVPRGGRGVLRAALRRRRSIPRPR